MDESASFYGVGKTRRLSLSDMGISNVNFLVSLFVKLHTGGGKVSTSMWAKCHAPSHGAQV